MADELFASQVMADTIDLVSKGLRDLRGAILAPFYDRPELVPANYASEAYPDMADKMAANDLDEPTAPAFETQVSSRSGRQLFISFLRDCGVVLTEETPDILEMERETDLSRLGDLGVVVKRVEEKGIAQANLDALTSLADRMALPVPPESIRHIILSAPSAYGELDPIVGRRMSRMRQYIRGLFTSGVAEA